MLCYGIVKVSAAAGTVKQFSEKENTFKYLNLLSLNRKTIRKHRHPAGAGSLRIATQYLVVVPGLTSAPGSCRATLEKAPAAPMYGT
jgi:hypothetical protein